VTTPIVAALGLGIAVGILGLTFVFLAKGAVPAPDHSRVRLLPHEPEGDHGRAVQRRIRQGSAATAVGLFCVIVTRWPVAGVLGALAAATLPGALGRVVPGAASKRAEAIAGWTELIRDSLAASAGLAQAIVVTASSAPSPIRQQVGALATRLSNGVSLEASLRSFAFEVDDPAAEFLVCALLLAATSRAQRLVEVLSALADSIREDVSMHLRVDASRASARSSVRTVVIFSLAFACTLVVIAHSYLSPFGTAMGQLVLAAVGLLYAAGLALMVRLVRPVPEIRLFDAERVA
jgi:Flp pilus assembly protein TadB